MDTQQLIRAESPFAIRGKEQESLPDLRTLVRILDLALKDTGSDASLRKSGSQPERLDDSSYAIDLEAIEALRNEIVHATIGPPITVLIKILMVTSLAQVLKEREEDIIKGGVEQLLKMREQPGEEAIIEAKIKVLLAALSEAEDHDANKSNRLKQSVLVLYHVQRLLESETEDFILFMERARKILAFSDSPFLLEILFFVAYLDWKDKDVSKLIIACELSGNGRMDAWIANHVKRKDVVKGLDACEEGTTPLISSVLHGSAESVKILLENGAHPDVTDCENHQTPLMKTTTKSCNQVLEKALLLLDKGAHINAQDDDGFTAFHLAIVPENLNLAEMLAQRGANINLPALSATRSPLATAIRYSKSDAVSLFLKLGINPNDLIEGQPAIIFALLTLLGLKKWKSRDLDRVARAVKICKILLAQPTTRFDKKVCALLTSLGFKSNLAREEALAQFDIILGK